ncbi:isopentenyl-diphosphate Delta-isomerase [Parafannyhessea umbonata]|uniref:Isopentenyl-diphosphate Delta-isomerase n=1 Tax=Parafannyhessea umbonata TaxID=604330 RepID=A0A1H1KYY2_9ACTN|nr:isopentenyl-diphosphate Delta-isomerase [Parafannyhessea umbonata]SDR67561.1 isopentenyl-diphosphate delta-isomerase [Parafannyhessea umbonata]
MASLTDMLAQPREDQLILVDLLDRPQGSMGKLACHRQARLHRAFSLFLYRESGGTLRLLLQRRAQGKYHSGGLLANSVCSHPRVGEALADAVPRRLTQELGVPASKATSLEYVEVGSFVYRSSFGNGLTEFEYDHVFVTPYDGPLAPDPSEVAATAWVDAEEALADLQAHPSRYASWFLTAAPMACAWLAAHVRP